MYYGLTDILFWVFLILFVPILLISIYIPGSFALSRFKIKNPVLEFVVSNVLGISLWGLQGYIFGYLNLRILTYVYCLVALIYLIKNFKNFKKLLFAIFQKFKKNLVLCLFIIFGSIVQLASIFASGLKFSEGLKYFGSNEADGIMHLAYIRSIVDSFPPQEPGLSGVFIQNYHYWTDLVLADLSRIWHLPISNLFFQFIPVYLAILTGIAAYTLVITWGGTRKMGYWFLFLLYFASDATYAIFIALQKNVNFDTPAIDSGVLQYLNMPHVFGKVVFIVGLIAFHKWIKEKSLAWGIITVILFSTLFGFKIYFGLFVAIGIISYFVLDFIWSLIKTKKISLNVKNLILVFGFLIASFLIFYPHNRNAGGLVYVYLEWPKSLLGEGSIGWTNWWLRKQVYEAAGNIKGIVAMDLLAVIIALVSIYGTRILGFFMTPALLKFLGREKVFFLIPPLIIFHLLGFFTIQESGGLNVFNFFSVAAVILSLFSAYLLSRVKSRVGYIFLVLFVILTLPRSIAEVYKSLDRLKSNDFRAIRHEELEALKYLEKLDDGEYLIQASPSNSLDQKTPYVAFFTNKRSYLSGGGLLETHNVDISARKTRLLENFSSTMIVDFVTKLKEKNIKYIYLQKNPEEALKFKIDEALLKKMFENKSIVIYRNNLYE